jgi:hypothetical protein
MPFVIAASRDYLKRCGVPRSPADLAQHDSIIIGNGQSWAPAGLSDDIEVPARVVLRFDLRQWQVPAAQDTHFRGLALTSCFRFAALSSTAN